MFVPLTEGVLFVTFTIVIAFVLFVSLNGQTIAAVPDDPSNDVVRLLRSVRFIHTVRFIRFVCFIFQYRAKQTTYPSKTFNRYRIIGNYQMYEVLDDTAAQVILAIDSGDSIRRVAQRLHTPYETVRQAVNRLEEAGYISYDNGLVVTNSRVRDAARELVGASAGVSPPTVEESYIIPQFGDWPFAFTRIDAVYVWTQGGYQVGRTPENYPLFIAVREQDVDAWETFFESFSLPTAFERQPQEQFAGQLQIVLDPQPSLEIEYVEGYPVIPRTETIEYMQEHYTQFQSALAMLDRMYEDLDLGVAYRESERAQS